MRHTFLRHISLVGAVTAAVACSDVTGPGSGAFVQVQLTDAPADVIASAEVWISKVYLVPGSDSSHQVVLFENSSAPQHYDLLTLRDSLTADLTDTFEVPAGTYHQLRLVVDSARVTLVEGMQFDGGGSSRSLKVPSGSTSGIKVQLASPVEAAEGTVTTILVDFDVEQNFKLQGNPDSPGGIRGILFTPTLVEKRRGQAATS